MNVIDLLIFVSEYVIEDPVNSAIDSALDLEI
jgi:hypothetical protein